MAIARSRSFSFALVLSTGLAAALLPARGEAYTDEQQQACTPDAFRLCNSEIPDVDRITACMIRNRELLSPPCKVFFRSAPEPGGVTARPALRPVTKRKPVHPHRVKKSKSTAS
ncbi:MULTISPECIES: hypothetical protein [unclassified Bradyrhizobium]|uniref:hypothetical protein n=1 Tax=unclassified Bradyrhizobium TaxID=2631580 RepID=UPI00247A792A|nr:MULTISPECIES: hypothetical protein [unclassified Bradyrhizobium]WGS20141.1 hypothetical protein MTX22_38610 [Bradyrhizobium sp. ISRA463]WGS27003.1 hypothetical protein MTX19_36035 [Bradyrhizobium sp. ISRA464]